MTRGLADVQEQAAQIESLLNGLIDTCNFQKKFKLAYPREEISWCFDGYEKIEGESGSIIAGTNSEFRGRFIYNLETIWTTPVSPGMTIITGDQFHKMIIGECDINDTNCDRNGVINFIIGEGTLETFKINNRTYDLAEWAGYGCNWKWTYKPSATDGVYWSCYTD